MNTIITLRYKANGPGVRINEDMARIIGTSTAPLTCIKFLRHNLFCQDGSRLGLVEAKHLVEWCRDVYGAPKVEALWAVVHTNTDNDPPEGWGTVTT